MPFPPRARQQGIRRCRRKGSKVGQLTQAAQCCRARNTCTCCWGDEVPGLDLSSRYQIDRNAHLSLRSLKHSPSPPSTHIQITHTSTHKVPEGHPIQTAETRCMPLGHETHHQRAPSGSGHVVEIKLPAASRGYAKAPSEQPQACAMSILQKSKLSDEHSLVMRSAVAGASPVATASVKVPPSLHFMTRHCRSTSSP